MRTRAAWPLLALLVGISGAANAQGLVTMVAGNTPNTQVSPGGIVGIPLILDMSQANGGSVQSVTGTITFNAAALRLDSLVPTGFGATSASFSNASAGGATYQIVGASPVSATTTVATMFFTAANTQSGSRIQLTVTSAVNASGRLALGRVLSRNADVCVAPIGVFGDANFDAAVNIIDAQQIARFTIGLSVANSTALVRAGDVNADQAVNILDAQQIARFAVSLPASARINNNLFVPPPPSSLVINRSSFNLTSGLQVLLSVTPLDASGQAMIGCHPTTWATADANTATVTAGGLVRGVFPGAVTITATAGGLTAQSAISVFSPDTTVAFTSLRNVTGGNTTTLDGPWMLGGLLADEWKASDAIASRNAIDQRIVADNDALVNSNLRAIYKARNDAIGALPVLIATSAPAVHVARMYFIIGYSELLLAENFCNGIYLNDASSGLVIAGPQFSNAAVYALAIAHFDTALVNAQATDAFTISVNHLIRLAKGRALIQTGQASSAAVVVSPVPTTYTDASTLVTGEVNKIFNFNSSQKRYTIGDTTGGVLGSLPFRTVSPADPRLPISGSGVGADFSTSFTLQGNWLSTTVAPIFNGIDARLIEAEAAAAQNNFAAMTAILNQLRTTSQTVGAVTTSPMPPLSGPGSISTLFAERAFWTFGRGQRLGDLRRLMRLYGQTEAQVFPNGTFHKGGSFGTIKNLPANVDEEGNNVSAICTDRNP